VRPAELSQLGGDRPSRDLYEVTWPAVTSQGTAVAAPEIWALTEADDAAGDEQFAGVSRHGDLAALRAALDAGSAAPSAVIVPCFRGSSYSDPEHTVIETVHTMTARLVPVLQHWLAEERWTDTRLVITTRGAVATTPDA